MPPIVPRPRADHAQRLFRLGHGRVPGVNETPRITSANLAVRTVRKLSPAAGAAAVSGSVISTSLFGSAPWSPPPLTVEVTAQIVAVPFGLTRPVMLRRPSVAGAQGRPVAAL